MVLITGGTSHNGREVAELLLATKKFRIRLGSRDTCRLAPILLAQGAEGVVLDSISLESMRSALQGVSSVYFIYPALVGSAGDMLVANLFQAAKETPTLAHIVYLSSMRAAPHKEDFELAHKHYLNEQQLIHSGIPFTILGPTYFHENLVDYFADSIRRTGEYQTSAGNGVWTSIAICDVASVAAAAIANPGEHAGKTYELREEAVTHPMVAEMISKVVGKKVTAVNLTPAEHYELVKKSYKGPRSVESMADQVVRSDEEKREGQFSVVTPDLEMVLGRQGVSLEEFLVEHADEFKEDETLRNTT